MFSDCHSLSQLDGKPNEQSLFLGFAAEPQHGVFSQKYPGSTIHSVSEAVWSNVDHWPQDGASTRTIVMHTVHGLVTMDGVIALFLLHELPGTNQKRFFESLVQAASEAESGVVPQQFEISLMAWFVATKQLLKMAAPVPTHSDQLNHQLISECHSLLRKALIIESVFEPVDFNLIMERPELREICAQQQQLIEADAQTFWDRDVPNSIRFQAELPSQNDDSVGATRCRVDGLATQDPQSFLYRFFARSGRLHPTRRLQQCYPLTYVHRAELQGTVHEHVISVDPLIKCHLREVSAIIEELEDRVRLTKRAKDNPRPGYNYNDPWYDARHSDASIIDTPSEGSALRRSDVLGIIGFQTTPTRSFLCTGLQISSGQYLGSAVDLLLAGPHNSPGKQDRVLSKDVHVLDFLNRKILEAVHKRLKIGHWVWDQPNNTILSRAGFSAPCIVVLWFAFWLHEHLDPSPTTIHLHLHAVYDNLLKQDSDASVLHSLCDQLAGMAWNWAADRSGDRATGARWLKITTD
jgi:hypothetical protein